MTTTNGDRTGDRFTKASSEDLASLYQPLRVVDVVDALDGIGYFNVGLMDPAVRPLWLGMKFWGEAATIRCVPANKPMWKLDSTDDIVRAHGIRSPGQSESGWLPSL